MNLWLYYLIFGDGKGLPPRDVDTKWFILSGRAYRWSGWYGSQLASFEWSLPKYTERRVLNGKTFRPFNSSRRWFIYEVTWAMTDLPTDIVKAGKEVRDFQRSLEKL